MKQKHVIVLTELEIKYAIFDWLAKITKNSKTNLYITSYNPKIEFEVNESNVVLDIEDRSISATCEWETKISRGKEMKARIKKIKKIFESILCLCSEGVEFMSNVELAEAIQKEANEGFTEAGLLEDDRLIFETVIEELKKLEDRRC